MKTNKFRVWDFKMNSFWYGDIREIFGHIPNDIPDEHIQQYIGLDDKNFKPIYEGDIVLYRKQNREVCIGEFWDGTDDRVGTFLQNPEIKHRNFGTNKFSAFTSCEIIGNIFENPELLK